MGKITEEMPMNITVYLGANEGSDPALKQAVEELGRWIGESGNALDRKSTRLNSSHSL